MTTPIVLDCDPGHDDAIAILLALASPELELVGVTTVAGNQTLEKTTANAIRVLELAGAATCPWRRGRARRSSASATSRRTSTARAGWTARHWPTRSLHPSTGTPSSCWRARSAPATAGSPSSRPVR